MEQFSRIFKQEWESKSLNVFKNNYDEHGKNVENILWKDASYRIDVLIFLYIEAKPLIINKKNQYF